MDFDIRQLERLAQTGDEIAKKRLKIARIRSGIPSIQTFEDLNDALLEAWKNTFAETLSKRKWSELAFKIFDKFDGAAIHSKETHQAIFIRHTDKQILIVLEPQCITLGFGKHINSWINEISHIRSRIFGNPVFCRDYQYDLIPVWRPEYAQWASKADIEAFCPKDRIQTSHQIFRNWVFNTRQGYRHAV